MENLEQSASSDLSPILPSPTLESSQNPLQIGLSNEKAEADGPTAGLTPKNLNELLSWLQTLIGEIEESGVMVRLFQNRNMLKIGLENVGFCPTHKMIHGGPKCPICQ